MGKRLPRINGVTIWPASAELITMIADGLTTVEIAKQLRMSVGSVETYRIRLIKKCQAKNSCHLVSLAYRAGVLRVGIDSRPSELITRAHDVLQRRWLLPNEIIDERLDEYIVTKKVGATPARKIES